MANPDERLIPINTGTDVPTGHAIIAFLNKISVFLNKGLAWGASASLLIMVMVVVANAVSRELYVPFVGTTEIVGWLAALSIAFALGFTQLQQGYVEIDALVERFPALLQRIVKSIMLFISTCFFAMVSWKVYLYALNVAANGNVSETLGFTFYPLIFLVALGFVGLTLALLVDFLKEIMGSVAE